MGSTVIQLQLILKQMSRGVLRDANTEMGKANLDKLIQRLFHHSIELEAFHFGEIIRGVDASVIGKVRRFIMPHLPVSLSDSYVVY